MSNHFAEIAFTPSVRAVQESMGSRRYYARPDKDAGPVEFSHAEMEFIAQRDSFYIASVSETDWPYVQHRGGPAGFVRVLSPTTLGFADYRGNRQYVSVGNLLKNDRVAMIFVDYPKRERLKVLGHVRLVSSDEPTVIESLKTPGYRAHVERGFVINVVAYDWNCPQHITPRFSEAEVETAVAPLRKRLAQLETELAACRNRPTRAQ